MYDELDFNKEYLELKEANSELIKENNSLRNTIRKKKNEIPSKTVEPVKKPEKMKKILLKTPESIKNTKK